AGQHDSGGSENLMQTHENSYDGGQADGCRKKESQPGYAKPAKPIT
ncbi:hypothetical protein APX70_06050, partial [Pseudomonas syringae pv. maculicola]